MLQSLLSLLSLLSNTRAVLKAFLAGEIIDNNLNPVHLSVAAAGYRIQSQSLHIPDRIGFFSPGPPRLQVRQAAAFMFPVFGTCVSVYFSGVLILFLKLCGIPISQRLGVAFLLMTVASPVFYAVLMWVMVCTDPRRAPGYEWEDWKLRKD